MTDGQIDFTLIKYDEGTQSAESKAAGEALHPSLRDRGRGPAQATEEIKERGCEIVSDPGVIPVKFRAPGGTIAELVPLGRYQR
jgi:lactoylglutathione lyase